MSATFTSVESTDTLTHVEIIGALDVPGTRAIELKFTASTAGRHKPVIIDLSKVTFISSAALGMLVQVARTLHFDKHSTVLLAPNETIAHAIRIAKLDSMMPIVQSLKSALEIAKMPAAGVERLH